MACAGDEIFRTLGAFPHGFRSACEKRLEVSDHCGVRPVRNLDAVQVLRINHASVSDHLQISLGCCGQSISAGNQLTRLKNLG